MRKKVTIFSTNKGFKVGARESILEGALREKIDHPYSCKNGLCGMCKLRLIDGKVDHLDHSPHSLSELEKEEGLILSCRAFPLTDVEVSIVNQDDFKISVQKEEASVISKSMINHDTWCLQLKMKNETDWIFKPGQFVRLEFGGGVSRSYSMANLPSDELLTFFIRKVPKGSVSDQIMSELKEGDTVRVEGPFGSAYLRAEHTGPIMLVAGGSGIAPIKSIIDSALTLSLKQKLYLYFGVREERDFYLKEYFDELAMKHSNFKVKYVVDKINSNSDIVVGRVINIIDDEWPILEGQWQAYLAGPPPLVRNLAELFEEKGLWADDIYTDPFYAQN